MGPGRYCAPITRFLAPSLPDWQQAGPAPWLLEWTGRGCREEGGPSTAAPSLSPSSPRRMVSHHPPCWAWVPPASLTYYPRSPWCPGSGDGKAPLPVAPLRTPASQGLHAPKGSQGMPMTGLQGMTAQGFCRDVNRTNTVQLANHPLGQGDGEMTALVPPGEAETPAFAPPGDCLAAKLCLPQNFSMCVQWGAWASLPV